MKKTILIANTKKATAVVFVATLMSAPPCLSSQVHEFNFASPSHCIELAPSCGFEVVADPDLATSVKFRTLHRDWVSQRGAMSSVTAMSMMRPYQGIIGMGLGALPLILSELKSEGDDPDQWFWALSTIAEANDLIPPELTPEHQGDYQRMAEAWLEWGKSLGYAR